MLHPSFRIVPAFFLLIACIALLATLGFNAFTVLQIQRGVTRVPWVDEWFMLQQFQKVHEGASLWSTIWTPYWGHRLVISRLIIFAGMKYASDPSLTSLTWSVACLHCLLLAAIAWKLFGTRPHAYFVAALAIVLNLVLSPLQAENFTWSIQTMFPLVFTAATASFMSLSLSERSTPALLGSLATALIASFTMPNGTLVWIVLVAQALFLRLPRRLILIYGVVGASIIGAYSIGYSRPEMGTGFAGLLLHPIDSILLAGMLFGAPFLTLSLKARIAMGTGALLAGAYATFAVTKDGAAQRRWISVLAAINVYVVLSAASIIAGRLGSDWLHRPELALPPRYFTIICTFYAGTGLLSLYAFASQAVGRLSLAVILGLVGLAMFGNPRTLLGNIEDWSDFFRGADATGAAMLLNVRDDEFFNSLVQAPEVRDRGIAFMRDQRIGVFAEPRARWIGQQAAGLFPNSRSSNCDGALEFSNKLPNGGWRVEGWMVDHETHEVPEYILITSASGVIQGLGRGGFRHHYFPGFLTEIQTRPIYHAGLRRAEWLGYVGDSANPPWRLYGVWPRRNGVCLAGTN